MKKIAILVTSASIFLAGNVSADDLSLKWKVRFGFEAGGLKQSNLTDSQKYITANRKNIGVNSNAYVGVRVESENEMMKYGAQIGLNAASRNSGSTSYERSHIFMESDGGKIELGSNYDVGQKMHITALTIARASGDGAESYAVLDIKDSAGTNVATQPLFPSFFLNKLDSHNRESTRKVTYYTPKFGGLQFGISYIPDTSNFGSLTMKDGAESASDSKVSYKVGGKSYNEAKALNDAISAGVTFEHHLSDMTSVKLAVTSEHGKPAKNAYFKDDATSVNTNYKIAKLNSYNVGAIVTTGNFSFVGSYTDSGKSLTSKEVFGSERNTRYYSAGAVYTQGPVGVSLSYYRADKNKNKTDTYVLGTDYTLAQGFQPYAEIACFNGKGKLPSIYNDPTKRKYKGMVFILGMTLSF